MPPSVASAPGSTAKNRPSRPSVSSSASRRTPGWTRQSRSPALTSSTRSICERSTVTPPCTGSVWPSKELPEPHGIRATPCAAAIRTTPDTSSVVCGKATPSGSRGAKRDSSRAWIPRIEGEVAKRSPSSSASASRGPSGRVMPLGLPRRAAIPDQLLLVAAQQPPARVVADVDRDVVHPLHAAQHFQRVAQRRVLGEHRPRDDVDDPEAPGDARRRRRGSALALLRRHPHRAALRLRRLVGLLERNHLCAGALRLGVQHPRPALTHTPAGYPAHLKARDRHGGV